MKGTTMAGDRAGLLVRVSSGGQDEANQVPDVEGHASAHGYRVKKRYTLHDKSAFKGEQQTTLDQIIEDVRAGIITVLVVWHSSRIERRELEYLLRFIRLVKEAGGRIESVQEGLLAGDNLNTIVAGYMNNEKSKLIAAGVQQAHNRIRGNGAFRGRDPFGYEITGPKYARRLTVIEDLRPIVAEIFQRVIDGESLADICTWLDSLKCKHAKTMSKTYAAGEVTPWWPAMLMRLIRHPAYSGRYYVKRTDQTGKLVTYTHSCERIVSRRVQRQAIEKLAARGKRGPRGNPDTRAMLKGAIFCPYCDGSPMYRITSRMGSHGKMDFYRCSGRGPQRQGCGNNVRMASVDHGVSVMMAEDFAVPITQIELIKGHDWSEEIKAVKEDIAGLGAEDLSDAEYDRRLAELRAERDRLMALPAEEDDEREVELDELWSEEYAGLEHAERGAWLVRHGFKVYASKTRADVVSKKGVRVWRPL
jgi:DNA invertase Pin-like site-specific DNA recombinase